MRNHSFFLHCDTCHHEVDFEGKVSRKHIGYPCPECGADMLTKADFKTARRVMWVISFFTWLGLMRPAGRNDVAGEGEVKARFHAHGGKLTHTEVE